MTSNDVPASGAAAGRRRALGRGPGTSRVEPVASPVQDPEPEREAPAAEPEPGVPVPEPERAAAPAEPPSEALVPESQPEAPLAEPEGLGRGPEAAPRGSGAEATAESTAREPGAMGRDPEPAPQESEAVAAGAGGSPAGAPQAGAATREPGAVGPGPAPVSGAATAREAEPVVDGVFKVRLANFEGPFDLLLQLISKHKLDVTEVALSKVTDEFMAHIRAMGPDWDLDQTTEFLVVAATLLDLKAARLLPAAEVEDEADLALLEARDLLFARLLQYRAYKQIADIFNHRLGQEARRYPRTVGLEPHHAELLPEVVISIGPEGFARLAVKAMQPRPKPQVYVDHIHAPLVSVQEQAGIVVARLRELGQASFRVLVEDTDDTLTVVARFLALLELYREKAVALDQETALGDLLVRWTGGDGDETPRVTDEFDRPPEEPKEEKKA
ncbi:segregation/condensation protein A [Streptomyces sp. NPDC058964]|uniref:segregation/condensation protein A n=1 Tax=Streptomyces sp. NPDC058964 TaxID=3346681 RepID=UPI0036CB4171